MIHFNLSNGEFGVSLTNGFFLPYLYRKIVKEPVKVTAPFYFPKDVWKEWFDEYEIGYIDCQKNSNEKTICTKQESQNLFFTREALYKDPLALDSMILPKNIQAELPTQDKYIVLIVTVYGHNVKIAKRWWDSHKSLDFPNWIYLSKIIKEYGYKVVGFGFEESCTNEQLLEVSDYSYYFTKKDIMPINNLLYKQILIMKHALTTVAFGGALSVPLCFKELGGVGYDGPLYNDYTYIVPFIQLNRNNFYLFPQSRGVSELINATRCEANNEDHKKNQKIWTEITAHKLRALIEN